MLELLIYSVVGAISVGIPVLYIFKNKKTTKRAKSNLKYAVERGLLEPISLHPKIDVNSCISTGACVPACPEGEILGVLDGRATMVSPTKCIGHGACEAACPVEAISLVFGTERRGIELPYVSPHFETNVPGVYIAGELGGMGLIRNAVKQGWEAVDYVNQTLSKQSDQVYDIAIVGAGPAGIAASLQAQKRKLKFITLEQDDIGGAVLSYPRQKLVMTQPMDIPLYGKVKFREILKEDLLGLWNEVITKTGLEVNINEKVETVERQNGFFKVTSSKGEYLAQRVLLSIGRRGTPRKLGVPGEKSSKVAYRLLEPEQYKGKRVLIVGGGDSAVEAALSLSDQKGTDVTLSYRKSVFSRIKEKNDNRIEEAIRQDRINVQFESNVLEIKREQAILQKKETQFTIDNDYVFVFAGGILPTEFLQSIGISIEKKFGER